MSQNEDQNTIIELLQKTLEAASRKHSGTAGDMSDIREGMRELQQTVKAMHTRLFVDDNGTKAFSTRLWRAEEDIGKLQKTEDRREDDKTGLWNHVKRSAAAIIVNTILLAGLTTVWIVTRTPAVPPQPQVQAVGDDKKIKEEVDAFLKEMRETKKQMDEMLAERQRRRPRPQLILPPFRRGARYDSGDVIASPDPRLPIFGYNRIPILPMELPE